MAGWIIRSLSVHRTTNLVLYMLQYLFIYLAPPIYSAAEYNILGRLMHYLPMHAPMHPSRVVIFFIYLGAAVEVLTAIGSARLATAKDNRAQMKDGANLLAASVILQGIIEIMFVTMVGIIHRRAAKANMATKNIRAVCYTLYGTSFLVLVRCICRAVEKFTIINLVNTFECDSMCDTIIKHDWYLYAFEGTPMVIYTFWLNAMHPGRFLPSNWKRYLDFNGQERLGPGWDDNRPRFNSIMDPLNLEALMKGKPSHKKFWLEPESWPVATDGTFAEGTASNGSRKRQEKPGAV